MPTLNDNIRFPRGLYGITPEWGDFNRLTDAVTRAARGGMVALQWRRKTLPPAAHLDQAGTLAALCRSLGLAFIVNDDWRLAQATDADGVHLGRDDGWLHAARRALGMDKIIGCSCYNQPDLARRAIEAGADYVAFGTVYPSPTKPDAVRATLDHIACGRSLARACATPRPAVVAIGGITPENATALVHAGADSIAMIQGLFEAPDITVAARACQALFRQESPA